LKQPIYLKQFERIPKLLENKRQTSSCSFIMQQMRQTLHAELRFTEKIKKKTMALKSS